MRHIIFRLHVFELTLSKRGKVVVCNFGEMAAKRDHCWRPLQLIFQPSLWQQNQTFLTM